MKAVHAIRQHLWFLLLLCFLASYAQAAEEYAGEFLTLGVGARALALGGSYVATADDATAVYWNPAGLAALERSEASFMHSSLFGLDSYDFMNYVHHGNLDGPIALSWLRVGVNDIPQTEVPNVHQPVGAANRPQVRGFFNISQNAFLMSYGRPMFEDIYGQLFVGGSGKVIYMSGFGNTNALGFGADLGGIWRLPLGEMHSVAAGVTVRDFFRTKLYWNTPPSEENDGTYTDIILPSAVVALAYQGDVPAIGGSLLLSVDGDTRAGWEWHSGAEYVLADLLALRVGLQQRQGVETQWDFTAGTGLKLAFVTGAAFIVDYAFMSSELGPSHRVSLGLRL